MSRAEYIPLPSEGVRGGQDHADATATCFCGAVQLLLVSHLISNPTVPTILTSTVASLSKRLVLLAPQYATATIAGR